MSAIAVIVVNFNAGRHLAACLESAAADLEGRDWQAIVVDNASSDDSAATVERMPQVQVVRNAENRGFGAAINQAVGMTDAPLLWLLNPDCVVERGAVARLESTLQAHEDCAIAAPQLLNGDGTTQASARREPTAWTGLFGRHSLLTRFFPRSAMARRELRAADLAASAADSAVIDWVMGAAMLIRRGMFDAVRGFDERYFLYWEDADLCRRLRARGWTTRYVPGARVSHPGEVSAGTRRAFATRAFHRSAYLYYATHVVPSPLNPLRWFAKAALAARSWWRVARGR
jgi:N-acetylglucosaminyl-diphospho-decaprenol L-rhamnosyltransferase